MGIPPQAVCVFQDGNAWTAVFGDFVDLQESISGHGPTFLDAIIALNKTNTVPSFLSREDSILPAILSDVTALAAGSTNDLIVEIIRCSDEKVAAAIDLFFDSISIGTYREGKSILLNQAEAEAPYGRSVIKQITRAALEIEKMHAIIHGGITCGDSLD